MNVNFNGYDENVLTFEAGTNLKTAGVPVMKGTMVNIILMKN